MQLAGMIDLTPVVQKIDEICVRITTPLGEFWTPHSQFHSYPCIIGCQQLHTTIQSQSTCITKWLYTILEFGTLDEETTIMQGVQFSGSIPDSTLQSGINMENSNAYRLSAVEDTCKQWEDAPSL